MRFKGMAWMLVVLATMGSSPASARSEIDLGAIKIIDPSGLITECRMTVDTGPNASGVPQSIAATECNRNVVGLQADVNLLRLSTPAGVFGSGSGDCDACREVAATAVAECYGGCPAGWSWRGLYRADTLHVVEVNLGSAVYPPPGAECHWEYTRVWCTAETMFIV